MRQGLVPSAALLMLAWCTPAAQASSPNRPVETQRFATETFAPYVDLERPSQTFYPALVTAVLSDHGQRAVFVERPWERASKETAEGAFEGSFPYLYSEARARVFLFSDPLLSVPSYLFVRRDKTGEDPDTLVMRIKTTCYLRDSLLPERLQLRVDRGQVTVTRVDDMAQCFRMLASGRVDAVSAGVYNANATLRELFGEDIPIVAVGRPLDRATLHVVWPRRNPESEERRQLFNQSLRRLRQNGEWARLKAELLPAGESPIRTTDG